MVLFLFSPLPRLWYSPIFVTSFSVGFLVWICLQWRRRGAGWNCVSKLLSRYRGGRWACLAGLWRSFGADGNMAFLGLGSHWVGQSIVAEGRVGIVSSIESFNHSMLGLNCTSSFSRTVGSSWSLTMALVGIPEPTACPSGSNPVVPSITSCRLDLVSW